MLAILKSNTFSKRVKKISMSAVNLGCFEKPETVWSAIVLEHFGSMELTLCRQLCLAEHFTIFLIGHDFCYCANGTDALTPSNSSACAVACPVHREQKCGDGSVLWAYETGCTLFYVSPKLSNNVFINHKSIIYTQKES